METKRLIIRKFRPSDWRDLYEYLSDPEVVKFEPYETYDENQAKEEAENRSQMDCFFAVVSKKNNKVIGNLYFDRSEFGAFELGYVFNRRYQRKGYAFEAATAIMEYGFTKLGARRIVAMCNPLNTASWNLLEKLGMRREGHLIKNICFKFDNEGNPIWCDTYEYAILKSEWKHNNI